jgi:hypothetical protein
MASHEFWGKVEEDWAGLSSEHKFKIPYFEEEAQVFLGEELFEEGEEYKASEDQLDEYEKTFRMWLDSIDAHIATIKEQAFGRYKKIYAHYHEDSSKSGKNPLGIDSADKHFEYMKKIKFIRITGNNTLKIAIKYEEIDKEHGLEIKFKNNQFEEIGGIAET